MPKENLDLIKNILESAEKQMLDVVSIGANSGDYATIRIANNAAMGINKILSYLPNDSETDEHVNSADSELLENTKNFEVLKKTSNNQSVQFQIEHSTLKLSGPSKASKAGLYTQKIPRSAYNLVVHALKELGNQSDGIVHTGELKEFLDTTDKKLPSYMVYGVLRFLRSEKVISPARQGAYVVEQNIEQSAYQAWQTVAAKVYE